MEDQGKRLILAVVACVGILLLWGVIFPSKKDETPPPVASGAGTASQVATGVSPIGKPATPVAPVAPPAGSGSGTASGSGSGSGSGSAAPAPTPVAPVAAAPVVASCDHKPDLEFDSPQLHAVFTKCGGNLLSWKLKDERYQTTQEHGEIVEGGPLGGAAFDVNFLYDAQNPQNSSTDAFPIDARWTGTQKDNTITYTYS